MSTGPETIYRFTDASHWQAGVRENLVSDGGDLRVPDRLCLELIAGTESENSALVAFGPCGRLNWIRPDTRTVLRRHDFGLEEVGVLFGYDPIRAVAIGRSVIWALTDHGLERHAYADLQLLDILEHSVDRAVHLITSDGHDGLWALHVDTGGAPSLRHLDCWGRSSCDPIELPSSAASAAAISATSDGRSIVILEPGRPPSLLIVDGIADRRIRRFSLPGQRPPPVAMVVGSDDRISVLSWAGPGEPKVLFETFALTGELEDQQALRLPDGIGPVEAIAAGSEIVVAGPRGLAAVVDCTDAPGDRVSTFITPALISPAGEISGWNRADVIADLPEGTTVELTWAATDDPILIGWAQAVFDDDELSPLDRFKRLDSGLPWANEERVTYGAQPVPAGPERLPALLDPVDETHLWLRVRLLTPAGRESPQLSELEILYPEQSYIDDLPAVYRESVRPARLLRRILAPFEVLFGELDERLDRLPDQIHPGTAPDEWTDYLLSWLGFPPLGDLEPEHRHGLLAEAGDLLADRGTIEALRRVLAIVTEGRSTVEDLAEGPTAWFLPGSENGRSGPRLGVETLVAGQQPPAARAGDLRLGETPVGRGCVDPSLVLAERSRIVRIRIETGVTGQEELRSIIERLLLVFAPAHCRLDVRFTAVDGRRRTRQLDVDFRLPDDTDCDDGFLYHDGHWQLGANTCLASWRLPEPLFQPAVLDHSMVEGHPSLN